jgi:hypothetical protein
VLAGSASAYASAVGERADWTASADLMITKNTFLAPNFSTLMIRNFIAGLSLQRPLN